MANLPPSPFSSVDTGVSAETLVVASVSQAPAAAASSHPFDSGAALACGPDEAAAPDPQMPSAGAAAELSDDEPYGVGPCMINDLPIIRAENERKRRELLEQSDLDCIGEIFAGAKRLEDLDAQFLFELDPGNQKYRGMRKPRLNVAAFMHELDEPPLFIQQQKRA